MGELFSDIIALPFFHSELQITKLLSQYEHFQNAEIVSVIYKQTKKH